LELLQRLGGDTPDLTGQALARAEVRGAIQDARAEREAESRRAEREQRAETMALLDRQMGGAMEQVRRHQGDMAGLQERVDDLEAQLAKARGNLESCRSSLTWWSERLMLADETVSRSAAPDPVEAATMRAQDALREAHEGRMVLERPGATCGNGRAACFAGRSLRRS
jgi:chromosome segregation ATPase